MPLYEYQCTQCSERLEIIQRLSDPPYAHCPKCGGEMKKLISAPAIQFKGSGWYKTDYASSKPSDTKGDKKSDTADSKPASETKTESKSESKPETKAGSSN